MKRDFNFYDAFKLFDFKNRGFFSQVEMELALKDLRVFSTMEEYNLLFKRLDKDRDGVIKYTEFIKGILPEAAEYAELMHNRKPLFEPLDPTFELGTTLLFKKLLEKMILGEW